MRTLKYIAATCLLSFIFYLIYKIEGVEIMLAVGLAGIIISLGFIEEKLDKK
jgi:ABC-type multidrug transport system permease subunit